MNGASSHRRSAHYRAARRARIVARWQLRSRMRKEADRPFQAHRARLRRSFQALVRVSTSPCQEPGRLGCQLPPQMCAAVCRNKSAPNGAGSHGECLIQASWSADLMEVRHEG